MHSSKVIQQNDTTTLLNQADYGTLIAQNSSVGSWKVLSYKCPILPIHAALLHTGKILFFAGSGNDPNNVNFSNGTAVWDVSKGTFSLPANPVDNAGLPIDMFCAGHSFLSDGRLMVAGGTDQYDPFQGLPSALVFDPSTEQWTKIEPMNAGRWYPTVVTLGDGRIIALSGLNENGSLDTYPDIYSDATDWIYFAQPTSRLPMYSHIFLLSSGKLFYSGGYFYENHGVWPRILTLPKDPTQKITETSVSGLVDLNSRSQCACVLLPPAQDQKVMIIGGGDQLKFLKNGSINPNHNKATSSVNIVDLKASTPTYKVAAPLKTGGRMHHNAVLLPDRTVFVCNGSGMYESETQARRTAEIYDPATNTWTVAATASVTRLYHSVALLLPDGRVVTAGGNPERAQNELRLEVYSPPYMSKTRPVIQSAPQKVKYGQSFQIQTPQAQNINKVNLIKPMATTHGLDTEQRLVGVKITSRTSTSLNVAILPEFTSNVQKNIAPAGWYMLSILDNSRVPSVAKWIQLVP